MSTLETMLAIISVVSFGLAVFSFVRTEIKKANERAKVEVMREKLNNLQGGLASLFYAADGMVQTSKRSDATLSELGNMARIVRGDIGTLLGGVRKYRISLDKWRFGVMIPSDKVEEMEIEAPKANEKVVEESPTDAGSEPPYPVR